MTVSSLCFSDYTYTISHATSSVATYRYLRRSGGLWDKTAEACAIGLPRSLFCVQVLCDPPFSATSALAPKETEEQPDPRAVAMGRLTGDGGLSVHVVDIVVVPFHQGRGLGKLVMRELMRWIAENVPECAYVSLVAAGESRKLYELFGFEETAKGGSVGMSFRGTLKEWR